MAPRPRLRPCTCARRPLPSPPPPLPPPRHEYSTASSSSTPSATSEPILDFLYPTFGFFSRSLPPLIDPPIRPSSPQLVDLVTGASISSVTRNGSLGGTWRRGWTGLSSSSSSGKCVCGRATSSCLRCRAASTMTQGRIPRSSEDQDRETAASWDTLTSAGPPSPPPPLEENASHDDRPGSTGVTRDTEAQVAVQETAPTLEDLRSLMLSLSHGLPQPGSRPLSPRSNSRTAISRRYQTFDDIYSKLEQLWHHAQTLQRSRGAPLPTNEQLDFVRLFSRLARALRPSSFDPLAAASDNLEQISDMRQVAGARMLETLQSFDVFKLDLHPRSIALLWIDAVDLHGPLPLVPFDPPSAAATTTNPLLAHLATLFLSSPTDEVGRAKLDTSRRSALGLLFDSWSNSLDGPSQAINLLSGWGAVECFDVAPEERGTKLEIHKRLLRRSYGGLLARLSPTPSAWFTEHLASSPDSARNVGPLLVSILATTGSPIQALRIWEQLDSLHRRKKVDLAITARLKMTTALVQGLTHDQLYEDAKQLGKHLAELARPLSSAVPHRSLVLAALRTLLKVASATGDQAQVDSLLQQLDALGWGTQIDAATRRLRAASRVEDHKLVRSLYNSANAEVTSSRDRQRLTAELVQSRTRIDDLVGATEALEALVDEGLHPTVHTVNTLLFGFAARHDVDSTYALFGRLANGEFGSSPDVSSFQALVYAHANVRDVSSAIGVIERIKEAGLEPTIRVWTTLMNAYVELGDWRAAFTIYAFLEKHPNPLFRPDTAAVNIMLKAAVLTATPATTVLSLLRQALDRGLRPNSATYTLVMQSVCSAGLMDIAEELFTMMDANAEQSELPTSMREIKPDVFVFSSLVAGYLKAGEPVKARACLTEMRRRDIAPTSITYGIIVGSFLRLNTEVGRKRASEFALQFLEPDGSPLSAVRHRQSTRLDRHLARGDELLNVFAPILHALAKDGDASTALETFQLVLNAGARPSIELYTTLMDAYRRSPDDSALEIARNVSIVWDGLHRSVLEAFGHYAEPTLPFARQRNRKLRIAKAPMAISPAHANSLCLPFSIVLSTSSRAGRITEIRRLWLLLSRQRFAFDAGNWNELAKHFARSGEVNRALEVLEKVLLAEGVPEELQPWLASATPETSAQKREEQGRGGVEDLLFPSKMAMPRTRTPSRNWAHRQFERDAQRLRPESMEQLLASPATPSDDAATDGTGRVTSRLEDAVTTAQQTRRAMYWFPHAATMAVVDRAMREVVDPAAVEVVLRGRPRCVEALRAWRSMTRRSEEA